MLNRITPYKYILNGSNVVYDRLHGFLEQLPMRMARSYLELINNSLKLYKIQMSFTGWLCVYA